MWTYKNQKTSEQLQANGLVTGTSFLSVGLIRGVVLNIQSALKSYLKSAEVILQFNLSKRNKAKKKNPRQHCVF